MTEFESELETLCREFCRSGSDKITKEDFKKMLELIWTDTGKDRAIHYLRIICQLLMDSYKAIK